MHASLLITVSNSAEWSGEIASKAMAKSTAITSRVLVLQSRPADRVVN